MTDETQPNAILDDDGQTFADQLMKSAPADVRFICVVVLLEHGPEFAMEQGSRAQLYEVDASCATHDGKVNASLGTAVSVLRQLADETERRYQGAGFASVAVHHVKPPGGDPS